MRLQVSMTQKGKFHKEISLTNKGDTFKNQSGPMRMWFQT